MVRQSWPKLRPKQFGRISPKLRPKLRVRSYTRYRYFIRLKSRMNMIQIAIQVFFEFSEIQSWLALLNRDCLWTKYSEIQINEQYIICILLCLCVLEMSLKIIWIGPWWNAFKYKCFSNSWKFRVDWATSKGFESTKCRLITLSFLLYHPWKTHFLYRHFYTLCIIQHWSILKWCFQFIFIAAIR